MPDPPETERTFKMALLLSDLVFSSVNDVNMM